MDDTYTINMFIFIIQIVIDVRMRVLHSFAIFAFYADYCARVRVDHSHNVQLWNLGLTQKWLVCFRKNTEKLWKINQVNNLINSGLQIFAKKQKKSVRYQMFRIFGFRNVEIKSNNSGVVFYRAIRTHQETDSNLINHSTISTKSIMKSFIPNFYTFNFYGNECSLNKRKKSSVTLSGVFVFTYIFVRIWWVFLSFVSTM